MIKKIDEFIKRAYETSCSHGFHDEKTSVEHQMMLVISEIGEAVEADRKNRRAYLKGYDIVMRDVVITDNPSFFKTAFGDEIKDTVEDELADVCIRLFDMCGCFNIKPYRSMEEILTLRDDWRNEFGSMRFSEQAYSLVQLLAPCTSNMDVVGLSHVFGVALFFIHYWTLEMGIDLARHIELKMTYNEMRGYKRGKNY